MSQPKADRRIQDRERARLRELAVERRRLRLRTERLSQDMRQAVRDALDAGVHVTEVARDLGISRQRVYDLKGD